MSFPFANYNASANRQAKSGMEQGLCGLTGVVCSSKVGVGPHIPFEAPVVQELGKTKPWSF